MKSKLLLLVACLMYAISLNAQELYTDIPDSNFELALSDYDDIPNDSQIPTKIISTIPVLDVNGKNISDLSGIEDFTSLTYLACYNNQLSSLDVSKNVSLNFLYAGSNQLSSLDVSNNPELSVLNCHDNQLSNLDVSKNESLLSLFCDNNQLSSLDVTKNKVLTKLEFDNNQIANIDLTQNLDLTDLFCYNNSLKTLDVSKNTALFNLYCFNNQLTSLDVSLNTNLIALRCGINQLTSLDLTQNIALNDFIGDGNSLSSLDLSQNSALSKFSCNSCNLSSLSVKNGNNYTIIDSGFKLNNNPDLFCVEVDDAAFSGSNWFQIAPQIEFKNSCDDSLFSEYVIIAEEEVELKKHNKVLSGNIGVTDSDGEAEFKWYTIVEETVEAADIYVSYTSSVGATVMAPADVTLPEFLENNVSNSNSPNVTVNKYQTVELHESNYGTVKVKKGGKVVFTNSNVYLREIKVERSATVNFTQCANVYINKKLNFHRNTTFNDMGNSVFVYVDDKIQVGRGSKITASMYANNRDIKVKAKYYNRTYMKGLFIAEKVKGKKHVTWNKDESFSPCGINSNVSAARTNGSKEIEKIELRKQMETPELKVDKFIVKSWPIPSDYSFNIKVNSPNKSEFVLINVYDINGRLIHKNTFSAEKQYSFGSNLQSGIYIVKIIQAKNINTLRVIKK